VHGVTWVHKLMTQASNNRDLVEWELWFTWLNLDWRGGDGVGADGRVVGLADPGVGGQGWARRLAGDGGEGPVGRQGLVGEVGVCRMVEVCVVVVVVNLLVAHVGPVGVDGVQAQAQVGEGSGSEARMHQTATPEQIHVSLFESFSSFAALLLISFFLVFLNHL